MTYSNIQEESQPSVDGQLEIHCDSLLICGGLCYYRVFSLPLGDLKGTLSYISGLSTVLVETTGRPKLEHLSSLTDLAAVPESLLNCSCVKMDSSVSLIVQTA